MRAYILWALLVVSASYAQHPKYKNLVFEGAGIRGIAYAGVLSEFEQAKVLDSIQKVAGTSAGAIIALAIALGYDSKQIDQIVSSTNFDEFNDGQYFFVGGIQRIKKHYGWYRGNRVDKWLAKIVAEKTSNPNTTFRELHAGGYKDLYVTATCLNQQKMLVFSNETYPDMKIKDAVRISMSIPLYFEAVWIDGAGKVLKNGTEGADIVVDGGIIANFPITIFDSTWSEGGIKKRKPNTETIGIRIDSDAQIVQDAKDHALASIDIKNIQSYLSAFYAIVMENLNRHILTDDDWGRTISVSSKNIGPKVRQLSTEQKALLINSGKESVQRFLFQK